MPFDSYNLELKTKQEKYFLELSHIKRWQIGIKEMRFEQSRASNKNKSKIKSTK